MSRENAYLEYLTEDGRIVNAIVWDGEETYNPGEGREVVALGDSGAWIGWTYDPQIETFTPPPEPDEEPKP